MEENRIRHLEMIQNVIIRMASNSSSLKSWAITLVVGILTFSNKDADKLYSIIVFVPIIVFWIIDTYYLQLERKYRVLFDYVRKSNADVDFAMDPSILVQSSNNAKRTKFISCLFAKPQQFFYLPITVIVILILVITK